MLSPLLLLLLALLAAATPIAQGQQGGVLTFAQLTTVSCPTNGQSATFNYTLTMPVWPNNNPATSFVLNLVQVASGQLSWPVSATDGTTIWTALGGTQDYVGELWVPQLAAGTLITVSVECDGTPFAFTIEPVIPALMNGAADVPNFYTMNVDDSVTAPVVHAHWWTVPASNSTGYLWSELCKVPSASSYLYYMRVVFPGATGTNNGCKGQLYNGNNNLRLIGSVTTSFSYSLITPTVFYVYVYAISLANIYAPSLAPLNYNLYQASSGAPFEYYGAQAGYYKGIAIKVGENLFISGIGDYYPEDTDVMKLYYYDKTKNANLNSAFFASACYLKTQGQSALVSGHLVNGTQDRQMLLGSINMVKAKNFFKGRGVNARVSPYFAVTYGGYVVLPNIYGTLTEIALPDDAIWIGVVAGLSTLAGLLAVGWAVSVWHLRRQRGAAYKPIK